MNLSQLQYFCKLAELQHYTKAAEQLYITQPTLSNSIARLEDELGVPLFEREGRNVRLTKYGREFNGYAKEALDALEKGKALAQDEAGQYTGNVSIGTIYTVQDTYLPALVRSFRNEFGQGPTINMYQGLTIPLIEGLEQDTYDVVLTAYVPDKPNLQFVPVLSQSLAIMAHRDHPLAKKDEVTIADLHGEHLVTYRPTTPLGSEVKFLLDEENVRPSEFYDDEITIASMVDSNPRSIGLALDTLGFAAFNDLATIPLADVPDDFHPIYLVFKKGAYKSPAVEHFIAVARDFVWPAEADEDE